VGLLNENARLMIHPPSSRSAPLQGIALRARIYFSALSAIDTLWMPKNKHWIKGFGFSIVS
jgi:hypothetical protein